MHKGKKNPERHKNFFWFGLVYLKMLKFLSIRNHPPHSAMRPKNQVNIVGWVLFCWCFILCIIFTAFACNENYAHFHNCILPPSKRRAVYFVKKKILFLVGKMLYMSLYRNKKFILDDVFQQNASKFVVLQKQPTY